MFEGANLASGRSQSVVTCGMTWGEKKQEKMNMFSGKVFDSGAQAPVFCL